MFNTPKRIAMYAGAAMLGFCLTAGLSYGAPAIQKLKQLFSTGTAASPAIGFHADPDTGLYRSAADTVGVGGGGAAAMTVTPGTLAMKKSSTTNLITSDTTATAMTSTVAALTVKPTATPAANDLVFQVVDDADTSLFKVDLEGDATFAGTISCGSVGTITGDLTLGGGDFTSSKTNQSFNIVSQTADATTSSTVAAITLSSDVNVASGDLILEVNNSAADSLLSVDEQGKLTVLTGIAFGAGNTMTKFISNTTAQTDLASAGAGAAVSAVVAVTDATLGDLCTVAPVEDDAAWDNGTLTCFVESSGNVKIVFHADDTGADPTATNTYKIGLLRF